MTDRRRGFLSYFEITNAGMLVGAVIALVVMVAGHAPGWAYGLWIAVGATTARAKKPLQ